MASYETDLGAFTFATSNSNALAVSNVAALAIFCSSSSGVFTVQVEQSSTGTVFLDLQSAGSDVTITAPNVLVINPSPFRQVRLASTYGSTGSTSGAIAAAGGTGFLLLGTFSVRG